MLVEPVKSYFYYLRRFGDSQGSSQQINFSIDSIDTFQSNVE